VAPDHRSTQYDTLFGTPYLVSERPLEAVSRLGEVQVPPPPANNSKPNSRLGDGRKAVEEVGPTRDLVIFDIITGDPRLTLKNMPREQINDRALRQEQRRGYVA
jgi:hypothetical protein